MSNESDQGLSRRRAIAVGIAGAAGFAAGAAILGGGEPQARAGDGPARSRTQNGQRMPVVYLPHGGGPWPFVDLGLDRGEMEKLLAYLRSLRTLPGTAPRALLVVSAHWEAPVPTVMTAEHPPMLYDYYGFPPASYEITWPAPGDPALAARVRELLGQAGFETAADGARGYDHGTFVPLKVAYPEADIPTVQLSLLRSLDPEQHLRMGRALAPLRDEGVLILGSGMSFHNLRAFRDSRAAGCRGVRCMAARDRAASTRGARSAARAMGAGALGAYRASARRAPLAADGGRGRCRRGSRRHRVQRAVHGHADHGRALRLTGSRLCPPVRGPRSAELQVVDEQDRGPGRRRVEREHGERA